MTVVTIQFDKDTDLKQNDIKCTCIKASDIYAEIAKVMDGATSQTLVVVFDATMYVPDSSFMRLPTHDITVRVHNPTTFFTVQSDLSFEKRSTMMANPIPIRHLVSPYSNPTNDAIASNHDLIAHVWPVHPLLVAPGSTMEYIWNPPARWLSLRYPTNSRVHALTMMLLKPMYVPLNRALGFDGANNVYPPAMLAFIGEKVSFSRDNTCRSILAALMRGCKHDLLVDQDITSYAVDADDRVFKLQSKKDRVAPLMDLNVGQTIHGPSDTVDSRDTDPFVHHGVPCHKIHERRTTFHDIVLFLVSRDEEYTSIEIPMNVQTSRRLCLRGVVCHVRQDIYSVYVCNDTNMWFTCNGEGQQQRVMHLQRCLDEWKQTAHALLYAPMQNIDDPMLDVQSNA